VAQAGQRYPRNAELWVPQSFDGPYAQFREARGALWLAVVGRLADGVSMDGAQTEMDGIAARLREAYPGVDDGLGITLEPMLSTLLGDVRTPLLVLLCAVALVLLIAVVNVANLLLVRGTARTRELALRLTLGAGRGRVVRQVLTEGLMLGAIGGALGAIVAVVAMQTLVHLAPPGLPRVDELSVSPGLFGAALGISLLATLLSSLAPALHVGGVEPAERLGSGQRATTASRVVRARSAFVIGQFTLALVLLVGAGLLLRSFARLRAVDPGFDPHGVLSASLLLPASRYPDGDAVRLFMQRLGASVQGVPGVEKTGTIGQFFMPGGSSAIRLEGEPDFTDDAVRNPVLMDQASPGFFEAAGMRLLEGRPLNDTDRQGAPLVAVVNREFVLRFMPDGDPLGRRFTWGTTDRDGAVEWFTVVGVVADAHRSGLSEPVRPTAFRSAMQQPGRRIEILLRTDGDPAGLASGLREAVHAIDPELPVTALRTFAQAMSDTLSARRFVMLLLVAFAVSAAALAGVGIYGVMAYVVGRRTREIGVRMALGAERWTVVGGVLRQGMLQAAVGVALGSFAALGLTRYLQSQLFALEPTDPTTFMCAVAVLLAIAAAACALPARRAAGVDVVFALKEE
jgi:putative ABC transport system permease protein